MDKEERFFKGSCVSECYGFHGPSDTYEGAWNRINCPCCDEDVKKDSCDMIEYLNKKGQTWLEKPKKN